MSRILTSIEIQQLIKAHIPKVRERQQSEHHALKLISTRSNLPLAREISNLLEEPLLDATIKDHNDGETYVRLHESVRETDAFILAAACPPVWNNYGELFVVNDAVSRSSTHRMVNVISYFGNARQDRKTQGREAINAKLSANLVEASGNGELKKIFIFEPHFAQLPGFFNTPKIDTGFATPIFLARIRELQQQVGEENVVLVSPDVGGVTRVRVYAKTLRTPYAIVDKWRSEHGKAEVMNLIGDVRGKVAVIIDDMIDTAGTICEVVKTLITQGARAVYVMATHLLLSGSAENPLLAVERLKSVPIEKVIATNSVPVPSEKMFDNLEVLSVASLIASFILNIYLGEPISPLLGYDD